MNEADLNAVARAVEDALAGPCAVATGEALAAACSGGADSVALVHALGRVSGRNPLSAVIFVDHGLRPVEAEREAARAAAEAVGAPFLEARLTARDLGPGNLQAAARHARYRVLHGLAPDSALIATGHTADDQAETLLARATRGTGLHGLRGIRPRDGRLVRPLLAVPRAVTRGLGLPFSDDPSNDTARFARNRLRATALPALRAENPGVLEAFAALSEAADGALALIDALLAPCALPSAEPDAENRLSLPLLSLPPAAVRALLRALLGRLAPDAPPSLAALSALSEALSRAPDRPAGGSLGNGWAAAWDPAAGTLRLVAERDPRVELRLEGPGVRVAHGARVTIAARSLAPPDAVDIPETARWPLRARACDAGLIIVDGDGAPLWSEGSGVPTCYGSAPGAGAPGPFALHVAPARPLTVVSGGFLRVPSVDSSPQRRPGRLR
jgi:tRNA(Ile)-lysidine synthase